MLFQTRFHDPIRRGDLTSTLRIWHQPRVKVGGRYALGSGSIVVERIHEIGFADITPAIARRCGFLSLVDLLKTAKHGAGQRVFLIEFHYVGSPPKPAVPQDKPTATGLQLLCDRLTSMDARSARPWTGETLQIIAAHPETRAVDLAALLGRERTEFKQDVRKLKALGLTDSLDVGYRLSARGRHVLKALSSPRNRRTRKT